MYDQDGSSSMVETNGARVDEMTKEEEELSSFTPKSPISKPYIPDELNDPTVYPEVTVHLRDGTTAEGHYLYHQEHYDLAFFKCDDDGGTVIDLDGKVVGLINNHLSASFVPSSILDNCVDLWRNFGCIPRLHLGMKFDSIRLLDPINVERMWRMHNIEEGLIVEKLENMLLADCKDHFNQGKKLNAKIDVSVSTFEPAVGSCP
ncbi:hypothetical protein ACQ4PT_051510 [Festuca glaucescens]